jgi:hypothetical protein
VVQPDEIGRVGFWGGEPPYTGHRTESDKGRAYKFKDAEKLIDDFFAEVERILTERKVPIHVVKDAPKPKRTAKAKTKPKLKGRKK